MKRFLIPALAFLFTLFLFACGGEEQPVVSPDAQKKIDFYLDLAAVEPGLERHRLYSEVETLYRDAGLEEQARKYADLCMREISPPSDPAVMQAQMRQAQAYFDTLLSKSIQARTADPGLAVAYMEEGHALLLAQKEREALTALNQSLILEPDNTGALILRALVYEKLGQPDLAAADEQRAVDVEMAKAANRQ